MPSLGLIRKEIAKLDVYYPHRSRTAHEMEALSRMWAEDLDGMSDARFIECVKEHRKRSRWFPTGADIIAIGREIAGRVKALEWKPPEGERFVPTAEDIKQLRGKLKAIG